MKLLLIAAVLAAALSGAAPANADPGPGPGMCQYPGDNYTTWYPCTEYQPWLPYGTADNPPYGSPLHAADCGFPHQHDVGCS